MPRVYRQGAARLSRVDTLGRLGTRAIRQVTDHTRGTPDAEPSGMRSVLFALSLAACAHQPEYRGTVAIQSSELVPVDPDVRVVADADKPLFHDAKWYRGTAANGPFALERRPPWQIRKLDQPYAYVHYRKDHPRDQTAVKEVPASAPLDLKF